MLTLINIQLTTKYIEANYIPEHSDKTGYVKLYLESGKFDSEPAVGFENTYPIMAVSGLKKIVEKKKSDKSYRVPNQKVVIWY